MRKFQYNIETTTLYEVVLEADSKEDADHAYRQWVEEESGFFPGTIEGMDYAETVCNVVKKLEVIEVRA